jgi:hypothetical protein
MSVVGIKVDVQNETAELVDDDGRIGRYRLASEAKGEFVLHAVCDPLSRQCKIQDALKAFTDFPNDLFIHHPSAGPQPQAPMPVIQSWEGAFRYVRDEEERMNEAKKQHIIEANIEQRVEQFGGDLRARLWLERRAGLRSMTLAELESLADDLRSVSTLEAVNTTVVNAITDSRHTRQAADEKRFNDLDGGRSAKMDLE